MTQSGNKISLQEVDVDLIYDALAPFSAAGGLPAFMVAAEGVLLVVPDEADGGPSSLDATPETLAGLQGVSDVEALDFLLNDVPVLIDQS